ncbi:no significant blast hit [Histoplasma capsulatum var. duboisii H88]|uniref:No significant blast hit n=1 Tax=Ajellomyces capsulatus (strain H88) TaxID=544711 RepID=A0A8A1LZ59_AJEC8|nr:no significant blast hit [Histoplasma capsulatum var. duboisii H88]
MAALLKHKVGFPVDGDSSGCWGRENMRDFHPVMKHDRLAFGLIIKMLPAFRNRGIRIIVEHSSGIFPLAQILPQAIKKV